MEQLGILLFVVFVAALALLIVRQLEKNRAARRSALLKMRLDEAGRIELAREFKLYSRLPDDLRNELEGLIHVFIEEKSFEACGGLEEVSLSMQRVIAAQACLLLLRAPHQFYSKLRSILVYPDAYLASGQHGREDVRLGESWGTGSVVLSWSSVISGGRNEQDGHDVSLHEFAHQLDQADGVADGVPKLGDSGTYRSWSQAFQPAFEYLQKRVSKGKPTVIDAYGAENPAEFFAVATETFYEKPEQLNKRYPEVYKQLSHYYGVDPLSWSS